MTLSNCYKPLPFRLVQANQKKGFPAALKEKPEASRDCGNGQARSSHGLRVLRMETGITSASGSALVELGHTKVLCEVVGPTPVASPNSTLSMEEGTLECEVQYLPNFGFPVTALVGASASGLSESAQQPSQPTSGRINTQIATLERELSSQLLSSLTAAVPLKAYPKNVIRLQVSILQDDGSALSACTVASSLALVNANVEVYDLVTSSTVAITTDNNTPVLLADPTHDEVARASATVTLSLLANWKEVTLWNQSGRLSSSVANQAISLCKDGCRTMHKFMRNSLLDD